MQDAAHNNMYTNSDSDSELELKAFIETVLYFIPTTVLLHCIYSNISILAINEITIEHIMVYGNWLCDFRSSI